MRISYTYQRRERLTVISRYEPVEPKIFRIGDIVEVQVSFVATPLQGGKWKMRTVLRAITLLDGSFAQVSV